MSEPKLEQTVNDPEFKASKATPVTEMTLIAEVPCWDPTVNDIIARTLANETT